MAFSEKFEDALLLVAEKVDGNQYLTAIKNAFTAYMPFIIVGSFATLFNTLICSTSIGLAALIPAAASLKPAFTAINFATMSFMTIPIVFLIAMNLAKTTICRRNWQEWPPPAHTLLSFRRLLLSWSTG